MTCKISPYNLFFHVAYSMSLGLYYSFCWCSRNVMLQTINSHLSMAAVPCTSTTIMHQPQFMILSCPAPLSTKDTAPQISVQLHPSAPLSATERTALMYTHTHTHTHMPCVYYVCLRDIFNSHYLGNGWPERWPTCETGIRSLLCEGEVGTAK